MSISVLMSIYYKEKPEYFHQAMESIWDKQTLRPNEIILIEDGELSKELYKVCEFWKTKMGDVLKIIKLKTNRGLTKALNIGLNYCTCEFIARMDTDDISSSKRFEKQVRFLNKNEDIHVVGGSIQEFNSLNPKIIIREYPITNTEIREYIVKASPLAHATVMFRRSVFDEGLRYSEIYRTSQDIALWFNMLFKNYRIANIKDVIYFVRISDNFYSRRSRQKSMNEFRIYWNGIINMYGINWKLVYPLLRLCFRLLPNSIVKLIYSSRIRKKMLN
jgi:glycosyltransferase involved in cell wall biosynthesis